MFNQRLFFPGTVTDRVVRNWLADDPYSNPGLMPSMVQATVDREEKKIKDEGGKLIWKDPQDRDLIIQECQEAVTQIEPALNELVLPYDYDVDFKFKTPMMVPGVDDEPVVVHLIGYMDIIVKRSDEFWAVYDVKHTKNNDYWRKTRGQLSFYDTAVEGLFGSYTSEVGLLQPLCKEPVKSFVLSEQDRTMILTSINSMVRDIQLGDNALTPDLSICYGCNVKHACARFQPVNGSKRVDLFTQTGEA